MQQRGGGSVHCEQPAWQRDGSCLHGAHAPVCLYTPIPCSPAPIRSYVLIATGRLIVHLSNRLQPGSCWAGGLFPSLQPPIALHVAEMLSGGTPAPYTAAELFDCVHAAPGCTRACAAPSPRPKQSSPCLSAGSGASALLCRPPAPNAPVFLHGSFIQHPAGCRPTPKSPGAGGECSCHGTFLQLQRNPGGKEKRPAKTNLLP